MFISLRVRPYPIYSVKYLYYVQHTDSSLDIEAKKLSNSLNSLFFFVDQLWILSS
jgi:hypothetical protein